MGLVVSRGMSFNTSWGGFALPITVPTLLEGETDGLAIDFTVTDDFAQSDAANMTAVQERNSSVDTLQSPHVFFTQSGTSAKYIRDSATTIGWSVHNLFLNSDAPATQNVTLLNGFTYTFGITGAGTLTGSSGASGAATAGSPVTFTATGTTGTFTVSGGTPTTMQINRGETLTAYLSTAGALKMGLPISYGEGLLCEPAATNIRIRSQTLDNANYTKTGGSISADTSDTLAPDGTQTADKFTATGSSELAWSTTIVSDTIYTLSAYAKVGTGADYLEFQCGGGAHSVRAWFDLTNGTVGSITTVSGTVNNKNSTIENVGGGWYRCTMTFSYADTGAGGRLKIADVDGVDAGSDSGDTQYWWGIQLEANTVATSYIPTTSASVTRAADDPNVATSSYPHSATLGSIYWDCSPSKSGVLNWYGALDDTSNNNWFGWYQFSDEDAYMTVTTATVNQGDTLGKALTTVGRHQMSASWAANNVDFSVDGDTAQTDNTVSLPSVSVLRLGKQAASSVGGPIFIRRLVYVPRHVENDGNNIETWRYNY